MDQLYDTEPGQPRVPLRATPEGYLIVQIAGGGGGGGSSVTNLTTTVSPTNVVVASDTGTDATIPLADVTNAGVMPPAAVTQLAGLGTASEADVGDFAAADHTHALLMTTDERTKLGALPAAADLTTSLAGKMANTLPAMQTAFNAGTAPEKAAFQASVSGDATPRVVLAIGQSNSQGRAALDAAIDIVDGDVWQYGCYATDARYKTIFSGQDPMHWPEFVNTGIVSPANWFARVLSKKEKAPVIIVPCGFGQTGMVGSRWQPGNPGGDLYENAIARANEAVAAAALLFGAAKFAGCYWVQGENDGDAGVTQATYAATLNNLIAGIRARVTGASESWFVIGSMPYETMQFYPGTQAIYYAHRQVGAEVVRCVFVPGPRNQTIAPGSNRHYTAAGTRQIGSAMAQSVAAAALKTTGGSIAAPIKPTGVAASNATYQSCDLAWSGVSGADNYIVEYVPQSGGSWSIAPRTWGDATTMTVTGLAASTAYLIRVTAVSAGLSGVPSASASATTTAAPSTDYTYTFEGDALGATPAGFTVTTGVLVAGASGVSGWAGQAARTTSASSTVALWASLNNGASSNTNQRVAWRRGCNTTGASRDGIVLRVQSTAAGGTYTAAKQGYWFCASGSTGALIIYKLTSTGPTSIATAALADSTSRYLRASVTGSSLTFDYSADGTTWTNAITFTDTTFAATQAPAAWFSGASAATPSSVWYDDIIVSAL